MEANGGTYLLVWEGGLGHGRLEGVQALQLSLLPQGPQELHSLVL